MMDIFNEPQENALREHLFSTPDHHAYAIVDGAASPGLLPKLNNYPADYRCLFRGELDPALAAAAPYLIKLNQYTPITEWLLITRGKDHNIFALVPDNVDFNTLHTHFRGFLRIRGSKKQMLYFRYYDPRVMPTFLTSCHPEQIPIVFGSVTEYLAEDDQAQFQCFQVKDQRIEQRPLVSKFA